VVKALLTGISMSGLLDKATAAKEAETVAPVKVAPVVAPKNETAGKSLLATSSGPKEESWTDYLQMAGWGIIVLAGILSVRGGEIGLLAVSVVALVGVGCLVQFERMKPELSNIKVGISVVLALLIALGPYAAIAIIPADSSMALTQIEVNPETDELSFYVRGSFDSSTASISSDGAELWTGTESLSNDFAKFQVPISDFFEGNAQNNMGVSIKIYEITVEADDGQTQTRTITPEFLNREVLESGARITLVTKTTTSGTNTETEVDGLLVESIFGLFGDSETTEDGGDHSMSTVTNYLPVFSDYTVQLKVLKGSSMKWQSPMISVDGAQASWTGIGGSETGSIDRWMGLPGTGMDKETGMIEILKVDDFHDGDGCYTFQIIITNDYYASPEGAVQTSNSKWDLAFDSDGKDAEMSAC
jgi:hypothetical protein